MTEKTKEVKLTYEESLVQKKQQLEIEVKKVEGSYHQLIGALNMVSVNLEEFLKNK